MRKQLLAVIAAMSLSLTAAPAFAATSAQDRKPPRQRAEWRPGPLLRGRVTAINGVVVTVNTPGRRTPDVAVTTTAATRYFVAGVSAPSLSNVRAGDHIVVLTDRTPSTAGSADAPATITAAAITVLPQPDTAVLRGEVKSASGSTLSLTTKRGAAAEIALGNAKIIVAGKPNAGVADLGAGTRVIVLADREGSALNARIVVVWPASRDNVLTGVVASVDGKTLIVMSREGVLVTVDAANAAIWLRGKSGATPADLRIGRPIVAVGTPGEGGTFTAQALGQLAIVE